MQDALTDPRCVVTAESLLIDGANGVCRDARLGLRDGAAMKVAALLLGAGLIAAWLLARRPPARARVVLVVAIAIGSAMPGAHALLATRADRPAAALTSAAETMRLHDEVRSFARRHGCARVTVDRCERCAPIVRLALAGLRCESPASIELHERSFTGACVAAGRTLVCGAAP